MAEREEEDGSEWYFSRKELEENSPSRRDGIDAKKEHELRRSYSGFMQALGMRLLLPQETIATAIVFCHRFFLRQSHAKNDMLIIAISCIHLAGKVQETRRRIRDVVLVSNEMLPRDASSFEILRSEKEALQQLRDFILLAERILLETINFDMYVRHPYRIVIKTIRKLHVPRKKALCQVAWNFTSDGLQTSLSLQFRPTHIAAGVLYLASRFLNVPLLPLDWWRWSDFDDVTERQILQVCFQVLDLYEEAGVSRLQRSNDGEGTSPRDGSGCSTNIKPRTISVLSIGRDKTHGGTNAMVLVGKDETREGKSVMVSIHKDINSRDTSSLISIDKGRTNKDESHGGRSKGTSSVISIGKDKTHGDTNAMISVGKDKTREMVSIDKDMTHRSTSAVVSVHKYKTHGGTSTVVSFGKDRTGDGTSAMVSVGKEMTHGGASTVVSVDKHRNRGDTSGVVSVGKGREGTSAVVSADIDNSYVGLSRTLGRLKPWDFVGTFHKSGNQDHEQSLKEQLKQRLLEDEEAERKSYVECRQNLFRALGLVNSSSDDDIDEECESN